MPKPQFCLWCGDNLSIQSVSDSPEEKPRLACNSNDCSYVHWDNPTPVVAAIVEYEGKVLLAHNKLWPPEWFALITGFLERNETPEEAVVREVKEELDLDGEIVEFVGLYPFKQANQILMVWHVTATGTVTLGDELDAWKTLELADVQPWPMGTGPAVRDWLKSKGY